MPDTHDGVAWYTMMILLRYTSLCITVTNGRAPRGTGPWESRKGDLHRSSADELISRAVSTNIII